MDLRQSAKLMIVTEVRHVSGSGRWKKYKINDQLFKNSRVNIYLVAVVLGRILRCGRF